MSSFDRIKTLVLIIVIAVAGTGVYQIWGHRAYQVDIVKGPGVTGMARLSDYHPALKGTAGDTNVFILDGKEPGATMLVFGGTHSDEFAATLTALVMVENAVVEKGRLILIPMVNNSGTRTTRAGEGQPLFYSLKTDWGEKTFRLGSRATSQADQWPDPEVYVHYPSKQMLADVESRNINRSWPGKEDGTLTQQIVFAVTEVMRKEGVDIAVDLHQGSTMFPVNNVIIAAESGLKIGAYASAVLRRDEGITRPVERAPMLYRGLFNREIDEFVEGVEPFLMEVPIPFCDLPTGPKTLDLMLTGKDEFLLKLAGMGRLYARYDENGWPVENTVGQHCSAIKSLMIAWSTFNADKGIIVNGIPSFKEMAQYGVGHYFNNPSENMGNIEKN